MSNVKVSISNEIQNPNVQRYFSAFRHLSGIDTGWTSLGSIPAGSYYARHWDLKYQVFTQWMERSKKMRLGLALVVLGILILLDRMGAGYGLREGWPWIVVALGIGGIFSDRKSVAAWVTMIIGIFILGAKYYSLHFSIPGVIRTYFLPVLLIVVGLLWLWKYQKD